MDAAHEAELKRILENRRKGGRIFRQELADGTVAPAANAPPSPFAQAPTVTSLNVTSAAAPQYIVPVEAVQSLQHQQPLPQITAAPAAVAPAASTSSASTALASGAGAQPAQSPAYVRVGSSHAPSESGHGSNAAAGGGMEARGSVLGVQLASPPAAASILVDGVGVPSGAVGQLRPLADDDAIAPGQTRLAPPAPPPPPMGGNRVASRSSTPAASHHSTPPPPAPAAANHSSHSLPAGVVTSPAGTTGTATSTNGGGGGAVGSDVLGAIVTQGQLQQRQLDQLRSAVERLTMLQTDALRASTQQQQQQQSGGYFAASPSAGRTTPGAAQFFQVSSIPSSSGGVSSGGAPAQRDRPIVAAGGPVDALAASAAIDAIARRPQSTISGQGMTLPLGGPPKQQQQKESSSFFSFGSSAKKQQHQQQQADAMAPLSPQQQRTVMQSMLVGGAGPSQSLIGGAAPESSSRHHQQHHNQFAPPAVAPMMYASDSDAEGPAVAGGGEPLIHATMADGPMQRLRAPRADEVGRLEFFFATPPRQHRKHQQRLEQEAAARGYGQLQQQQQQSQHHQMQLVSAAAASAAPIPLVGPAAEAGRRAVASLQKNYFNAPTTGAERILPDIDSSVVILAKGDWFYKLRGVNVGGAASNVPWSDPNAVVSWRASQSTARYVWLDTASYTLRWGLKPRGDTSLFSTFIRLDEIIDAYVTTTRAALGPMASAGGGDSALTDGLGGGTGSSDGMEVHRAIRRNLGMFDPTQPEALFTAAVAASHGGGAPGRAQQQGLAQVVENGYKSLHILCIECASAGTAIGAVAGPAYARPHMPQRRTMYFASERRDKVDMWFDAIKAAAQFFRLRRQFATTSGYNATVSATE